MGVSTDAIIAYGVELGEDFEYDYKMDKLLIPLNLGIEFHCSDEAPMYILAIIPSIVTANRGYPQKLSPSTLVIPSYWNENIKKGLILLDQPVNVADPSWLLFSWWG